MGGSIINSYEEYLQKIGLIEGQVERSDGTDPFTHHQTVIGLLREEARHHFGQHENLGNITHFTSYIQTREKMAWIMSMHVEPREFHDEPGKRQGNSLGKISLFT